MRSIQVFNSPMLYNSHYLYPSFSVPLFSISTLARENVSLTLHFFRSTFFFVHEFSPLFNPQTTLNCFFSFVQVIPYSSRFLIPLPSLLFTLLLSFVFNFLTIPFLSLALPQFFCSREDMRISIGIHDKSNDEAHKGAIQRLWATC